MAVAALVTFAGCSKCGGEKAVVADAGAPVAPRVERRSVEVRMALIQSYPEYRGTALIDTVARVTREIPGLTDASRDEALKKLNYAKSDGGWDLLQFHLEQRGPTTLEVSVPLNADQVGQLYVVPVGLSSQQLAMYLPRELPVGSERFELELNYSSSPEKCAQLIHQAMSLLLATQQWTVVRGPDWDAGAVPDTFTAELKNDNGVNIIWERVRGRVRVLYVMKTV
ncbi:MAG: hypothetical protein ACO1OB_22370 [Archangium sp.]